MNGSKSYDEDGYIPDTGYTWRQLTGKIYPIMNPHAMITTTTVSKGGYSWELTVIDNQGAIDKDTTKIAQ